MNILMREITPNGVCPDPARWSPWTVPAQSAHPSTIARPLPDGGIG